MWRDDSIGKEFPPAWLYNGLGITGMSFQRFVRRFDAAWYALGVIPLFFFVRGRTRSLTAATIAGVLLACAYAAVQRSTGLEYSRENFALPFIFAHFWLFDMALRKGWRAPAIVAGALLAVALATWDLTQLYLLLVVAYCAVRCLVRRAWAAELVHLAPTLGAALVVGLIVPYLWAHQFPISYAMLLGYGLMAWWLVETRVKLPGLVTKGVLVVLVVGTLLGATLLPAGRTYSHFRELLFAKLRYLNVKPLDPTKLSYEARILWTPALHSATTIHMGHWPVSEFRAVLLLATMAGVLVALAKRLRREIGAVSLLVAMTVVWLVLYLLFVRMQVFLIFFIAAFVGIGVGAAGALARRSWPAAAAVPVVALLFLADPAVTAVIARHGGQLDGDPAEGTTERRLSPLTIRIAMGYGRNVQPGATAVLVDWLKKNTPEDAVVLTTFPLEPTIFEYAGRRIVVHPKFETPAMREKVREFLEAFYGPTERGFYEFCRRNKVDYFVLTATLPGPDLARATREEWVYSFRYAAAATHPRAEEGTHWMNDDVKMCSYFRFRTEVIAEGEKVNYVYRVFEVVSEFDIEEAMFNLREAGWLFDSYKETKEPADLQLAADGLERAVELWPGCIEAWNLMSTVYAELGRETGNTSRAAEAMARYLMLVRQEQEEGR